MTTSDPENLAQRFSRGHIDPASVDPRYEDTLFNLYTDLVWCEKLDRLDGSCTVEHDSVYVTQEGEVRYDSGLLSDVELGEMLDDVREAASYPDEVYNRFRALVQQAERVRSSSEWPVHLDALLKKLLVGATEVDNDEA